MVNFANVTDKDGLELPSDILELQDIPPQIASKTEAEAIESLGDGVVGATAVILSSSFVINMVLGGGLSQLWSAING